MPIPKKVIFGLLEWWSASNEKELLEKLTKQPIVFPSSISNDTKDLISKLLQTDESKRISIKEFDSHVLMTKTI